AVQAEAVQAHYYWLALDEGLRPNQLLRLLPPNVSANVMLVRGSSHGLLDPQRLRLSGGCPDALRADAIQGRSSVELRTIDAVLAMTRAVHSVTGGYTSSSSTNASCNGATRAWPDGALAARALAKVTTDFNTLGSLISYNGTTRHFTSYIEAVSTFHAFYTSPL
uniref:ANF_receptor domain-containing protein n=1 Tax=Macrostomum lignano TaxID=282301 RepID=A0A1I8JJS5_9PLAT